MTLEDSVFCGPSMVFTNIYNPRAEIRKMDQVRSTHVKKGATIGANATIVCGTTLGQYCFIGAGTVVNRNIPDHALVVGNPAKQIGWVCECGERLTVDFECLACEKNYEKQTAEQIRQLNENQDIIFIDPIYFRPTEVETLLGDPSKAKKNLNWEPEISFEKMIQEMVEHDLRATLKEQLCLESGFYSNESAEAKM